MGCGRKWKHFGFYHFCEKGSLCHTCKKELFTNYQIKDHNGKKRVVEKRKQKNS